MVAYPFLVIPILFVIATILIDITMYISMGLAFPYRYIFSLIVMFTICGFLFLIKKPAIQYGICIFFLVVHILVAISNIVLFNISREIISLEDITAARQAGSLIDYVVLDFWYMFFLIFILTAFIVIGALAFKQIKQGKIEAKTGVSYRKPYRRNLLFAVATLAMTAYMTSFLHTISTSELSTNPHAAFDNHRDPFFNYMTFTNRVNVFSQFGTYAFYWTNISFLIGFKTDFLYDIEGQWVFDETFDPLPAHKRNLIMLQMEALEHSLVNPYVMPNLFAFLYGNETNSFCKIQNRPNPDYLRPHIAGTHGFHAIDRTEVTEYAALAGTYLDGIRMTQIANVVSPFALPHVLRRNSERLGVPYDQIWAFHNYFDFMYSRDILFDIGLGFDNFVAYQTIMDSDFIIDMGVPQPDRHTTFNQNDDLLMFQAQVENMAPTNKKFFSHINNITTHAPLRIQDTVFELFPSNHQDILNNLPVLQGMFRNLNPTMNTNQVWRDATLSQIVAAHRFDEALGLLLDRLNEEYAKFYCDTNGYVYGEDSNGTLILNPIRTSNSLRLIDTTTIVFFSDHSLFDTPNLLAPVIPNDINPRYAGAQGRMLVFYVHSPAIPDDLHVDDRLFTKFATHFDIYSTICDLFHIRTNTKFTLGISIFNERENIGFSTRTGLVFNRKFATYCFTRFELPSPFPTPTPYEALQARNRVSYIIAVKNNLRPQFRSNNLRNMHYAHYIQFPDL